jgi:hypothetical protein
MENGARLIPFFRFAYRGVYQSRPSGRLPDGRQCVRSGAADYPACCQSTCVTDAATPFVSVRLVCLSRACLGKALCSVSGKRRESKQTPRADFGCPHLVSLPRRVSRALQKTHTGRSLFLGAFPRACLGKMIVFSINSHRKKGLVNDPHRAVDPRPLTERERSQAGLLGFAAVGVVEIVDHALCTYTHTYDSKFKSPESFNEATQR